MISSLQQFGDKSWTQDKLVRVRKYLGAYTQILRDRPFQFDYIDGFAGTGYHELKAPEADEGASLYPAEDVPDVAAFLDGSARIALDIWPPFHKYIFIEKSPQKAVELEKLKSEFPSKRDRISIETEDANTYLQQLCGGSWQSRRAVLFLDPFGLQVTWDTLKAVADTKAIDTWILFPVSAVNRLLKRDGNIPAGWRRRLDIMFGEPEWYDVFFPKISGGLFDPAPDEREKVADMDLIGEYFNRRLATIFAGVARNPYTLRNTRGSPLFLLCFAVGNPNATDAAIRIAQDILMRDAEELPSQTGSLDNLR
ncbi:three-Cys-motif partner protein TcmP [Zavarzinella formosa]|uniref:three-Cys-motif partner protein TcmP n=1 Tax=Zavarzinella formosa TaxID=360055 RepID=UPI00031CEAD1|nr:three-Cys-motif partner protein TcmP [Zavarzinella formosa]